MNAARKETRSRWRFTLVLTGMIVVGPLLALGGGAVLRRAIRPPRGGCGRSHCGSNLQQIGLACHMWADENDGKYPDSLAQLMPLYVDNPKLYICRTARGKGLPGPHYRYVPGLVATTPGDHILAYEDPANHGAGSFYVLFADAHVERWAAEREPDLQDQLARQQMALEEERQGK